MNKVPVEIELLGATFNIVTDEDPAYLNRIVKYYENKIKSLENSSKIKDPLKLSILTGIILADELFKERNKGYDPEELKDSIEAEHLALKIIDQIDKTLLEE